MLAGALVALLVVLLVRGLLDDREDALPSRVRITEVPDSYRIVYEVRTNAGPDRGETVTRETVQVERPFRSLVSTSADGRLISGRLTELNRLLQHANGQWTEMQVPPAMAAGDLRLDRVLDDAVADGTVERLDEVRRVADRPCQVHRLGGPLTGGRIVPVDDAGGEHAEVCIDEAGLLLWEEWQQDGAVLQTRTALDVEIDPDLDDETFAVERTEEVPATDGGGFAERVDDDESFGDTMWALASVPDGLELLGRWSIVWPRLQTSIDPFSSPTEGRVAGIATVWADGPDALVLEQGGASEQGSPFRPHPDGDAVDLGATLGEGEIVTDGRGTEVRVLLAQGAFVRIWSTLPRETVLDLARNLIAR